MLREQSLRTTELLRLGARLRDDPPTRTLSHSGIVSSPAPPSSGDDLVLLKNELVSQLEFFGVGSAQATAMASVVQGQDRDADYQSLLDYMPNLNQQTLGCSFLYLARCILHVLNGGR